MTDYDYLKSLTRIICKRFGSQTGWKHFYSKGVLRKDIMEKLIKLHIILEKLEVSAELYTMVQQKRLKHMKQINLQMLITKDAVDYFEKEIESRRRKLLKNYDKVDRNMSDDELLFEKLQSMHSKEGVYVFGANLYSVDFLVKKIKEGEITKKDLSFIVKAISKGKRKKILKGIREKK